MTATEQKKAAKAFSEYWTGKGYEKGESQPFWLSLLRDVYGVEHPEQFISFEDQVHLDHTSFIDGRIVKTKVLIEQKGLGKDLNAAIKQSDGSYLTPFQQAKRYITELPVSQHPRWVVTCNFEEFRIYDMELPHGDPEIVYLKDLETDYYRLQFLVDAGNTHIQQEMEISIKAGDVVGLLYDAFLKQYNNPESPETLKSLNKLCVRLVFCLYAEDAGIFGKHLMFHDYLQRFDVHGARKALMELFRILNQRPEERDPYLKDDDPLLAEFPYVNGGLFADDDTVIPPFTDDILDLILRKASADFDWSKISPTIFGAVFESTLNPETRRSGGMHYTSIENIHKVIDPLFLDDLKAEYAQISELNVLKSKRAALEKFQDKLASLTFLDPAAGSGNFLTETFISLRRLENQVIADLIATEKGSQEGQIVLGDLYNPIKMSIDQFYGIEINDFACTVAQTALWIAESQMMQETEEIIHMSLDFLPLKTHAHIVEGNALRLDWEDVVSKDRLSYVMGNPPFVGGMQMSPAQKSDIIDLMVEFKSAGELDYVAGWYKKATDFMKGSAIIAAFVSTNSISQGQQATTLLAHLLRNGVCFNFAYQSFIWDSEASLKAHVHCVIVGFSYVKTLKRLLFDSAGRSKEVSNINQYLSDAPTAMITNRSIPICGVPKMRFGSMPRDGGGFILTEEERDLLLKKEPLSAKWIHPYIGSYEFINKKQRWCLWLEGANPAEICKCNIVMERVESVRQFRLNSSAASTRKFAQTPTLFCQMAQPNSDYIIVPSVSSERRRYVPMGFMDKDTIVSNLAFAVPDATLYHFGVLTSNVHMAWMRAVCGRLKSDYRYSKDIVYNNFPWPTPTEAQKAQIEKTAQAILDARKLYPDVTYAEMYGEHIYLFPEVLTAHQNNDRAVMAAYGIIPGHPAFSSEAACVAELMRLYQELTKE